MPNDESIWARIYPFRIPLTLLLAGVSFVFLGLLSEKSRIFQKEPEIELLQNKESAENRNLVIEIAGAVIKPGVYQMEEGDRIDDAIGIAGGLNDDADRPWVEKYLNRAARLTDGQKIFIPTGNKPADNQNYQTLSASAINTVGDQTISPQNIDQNSSPLNINNASQSQLDALPGIGPVYAQKIAEQRPYSNTEELLSKKVIPKNTFEKIKDLICVY